MRQICLIHDLCFPPVIGRCEICKFKFRFDPQYAENAPDRLPAYEVLLGLSSRFMAKWLPLGIRISIAVSVWLVVAPLLTNILYHGWMVRPSSILTRWKRELIFADIVSGAVTVAIIVISFLSLMSFADFLRVHWQQRPRDQLDRQQQGGLPQGIDEGRGGVGASDADEKIHIGCLDRKVIEFLKTQMKNSDSFYDESEDSLDGDADVQPETSQGPSGELLLKGQQHRVLSSPNASKGYTLVGHEQDYFIADMQDGQRMDDNQEHTGDLLDGIDNETVVEEEPPENEIIAGDDHNHDDGIMQNEDIDALNGPQEAGVRNENNPQALDPLDPFLQDDQVVSFLVVFLCLLIGF
jgi:hypothetical protein